VGGARRAVGKSGLAVVCSPDAAEALTLDLILNGAPSHLDAYPLGRISGLHEAYLHRPGSVTAQTSGGDGIDRTDHLLYLAVDELRASNWMRSKDGSKNRNRPKPLSPLAKKPGLRTGRTDKSPAEVMAVLAKIGSARS
jgi:hypothetical protein